MYFQSVKKPWRLMRHPAMCWNFYVVNGIKVVCGKLFQKNLFLNASCKKGNACGYAFLRNDEFNSQLKEKINSGEPFFSCRYGNSELTACFFAEMREKGILDGINQKLLRTAKTGPGVFPENEETYLTFARVYTESLKSADFNAYWGSVLMEEYMIKQYIPKKANLMTMRALEPFQYAEPWTMALKGKKVLVIHPFDELIKSQYEKRERLFKNPLILPDFELKTVKAIQSSGENIPEDFSNWQEALEDIWHRCQKEDYDTALLACGSYALPLAAKIKAAGKQAIVLGGMLQLVFGIKGSRWESSRPDIVELYNDDWVRASQYRVKGADEMVDGAAYW